MSLEMLTLCGWYEQIVTNEAGESKGYGFVHYDSEKSAQIAMQNTNGMVLHEKKV